MPILYIESKKERTNEREKKTLKLFPMKIVQKFRWKFTHIRRWLLHISIDNYKFLTNECVIGALNVK